MKLIDFPDSTRIWIYLSDRRFTEKEQEWIETMLEAFTAQWTAHDKQLKAGYDIYYKQVIILGVDEKVEMASGCSIDTSVHAIQSVEKHLGVNMFNRLLVAVAGGDTLSIYNRASFMEAMLSGELNEDSQVLDNSVTQLGIWREEWIKPVKMSWVKSWIPGSLKV